MIRYILALLCLVGSALPLTAQGRLERYQVSDANDNRVVYALPNTYIYIVATVEEEIYTPGPFSLYAGKLLGLDAAALQTPRHTFTLKEVRMGSYGVANPNTRFQVQFKSGSTAPYLTLTPDGIICAINGDAPEREPLPIERDGDFVSDESKSTLSAMSEEYISATSVAKQAEVAAREILRLRETRLAVVSGESEQPFTDGEAMRLAVSTLDAQELALTQKFTGVTQRRTLTRVYKGIAPDREGRQVAFRFASHLGALDADDLRGAPVYLETKITDRAPELDEKAAARKEKSLKGVLYFIPGRVDLHLHFMNESLLRGSIDVAQLGALEALAPSLFTNKKNRVRVFFNPENGSVHKVEEL